MWWRFCWWIRWNLVSDVKIIVYNCTHLSCIMLDNHHVKEMLCLNMSQLCYLFFTIRLSLIPNICSIFIYKTIYFTVQRENKSPRKVYLRVFREIKPPQEKKDPICKIKFPRKKEEGPIRENKCRDQPRKCLPIKYIHVCLILSHSSKSL